MTKKPNPTYLKIGKIRFKLEYEYSAGDCRYCRGDIDLWRSPRGRWRAAQGQDSSGPKLFATPEEALEAIYFRAALRIQKEQTALYLPLTRLHMLLQKAGL